MTEQEIILEELHELELLIRSQEKAILDYPSRISIQLGLRRLRDRENSLLDELRSYKCLQENHIQK